MYQMGMVSSTRRSRRAGGARREGVLDAVVDVLSARGYEHSRFADVSEASGVAVSTLQNYFGSREDMLLEALRRVVDLEVAAMEVVAAEEADPWTRLMALVARGLKTALDVDRMLVEFWRAAMRDDELREYAEVLRTRYRGPFATAVAEGCQSGAFRTRYEPDDIVNVLVASLGGAILPRVLDQPDVLGAGFKEVLFGQLADSLGVEQPAAPAAPKRQ